MIDIEELELEFNAFYGDKENEHTLLARMHPLIAEVKRLREAIADVANNMEAADPSLLRSFIRDLLEVIE